MKEIITYPNDILREECLEVCLDIEEILKKNEEALGLAAPQIGLKARVIGFKMGLPGHRDKKIVIMKDPVIIYKVDSHAALAEQCLSLPGEEVTIFRPRVVGIEYFTPEREDRVSWTFTDVAAIAAQHEIDHLNGKLIIDYKGEYNEYGHTS